MTGGESGFKQSLGRMILRAARENGIELDKKTWGELADTARGLGIDDEVIDSVSVA